MRVHHDDRAALRAVRLHGRREVLLRLELEVAVDREDHVGPRLGVADELIAATDLLSLCRNLDRALARSPRQLPVVLPFEAGRTDPVDVDEAQDLGRDGTGRVVPLGHGEEPDPRQVQVGELRRDVGVHLSLDVGERPRRRE